MSEKATLVVHFILYSAVVIVVNEACRYPDFVQSRGGERDWRGHLQSEAADGPTVYSVSFHGRLMRVVTSNNSFQRRCMLKVGNRTYLAVQRTIVVTTDRALQNRYLCMEFLRRGDGVLQLRTSRLASRMDPHLCAENELILDDRPLVDRRHCWRSMLGSGCQLTGGYDIHLYDRRLHRGVCDALRAETRLEASCGDDDGLIHFRFRYDFCVPSGLGMQTDQLVHCAATWMTDDDTFTVLTASTGDGENRLDAWCLRRPRRTFGRPFTAFLFRQLVCDGSPVAELADALMVDMRLSDDWGSSLCEDDYEGCAWDSPAECTSRTADCARTCSVCNDSTPTNCLFSAQLHGLWRSPNGATSLNVDGSAIMLTVVDETGRARSTEYECVDWLLDSSSSYLPNFTNHSVDEHLVVTRPGSGCRPRYACVQLQYDASVDDDQSPSVVHFHISVSRPWPIYDRLDCSSFRYVSHESSDVEVEQHFILLTSVLTNFTHGRHYVDCDVSSLPLAVRFIVEFKFEHRRCFAHIERTPELSDGDRYFRLTLDDCWKKNVTFDVRCVDRLKLNSEGAVLLVTEVSPFFHSLDEDSVFCWLFKDSEMFYLLSSADCDPLTSLERMQRGVIRPIAVFVDALTVTSSTFAVTTTISIPSWPSLAGNSSAVEYDPNNDSVSLYYSAAPVAANNTTSLAHISTSVTPMLQEQLDGSQATPNQTRHDPEPQQTDVGSRGQSDRSHAGMSSFAHVTNEAASVARTGNIAVDVFIFFARSELVGIYVWSRVMRV